MSQNLPVDDFKHWEFVFRFDSDFRENFYEDSDKEPIVEVDVKYTKKLHELHSDLSFLPEIKKLKSVRQLFLQQ